MKLTVASWVHVKDGNGECMAALVTRVKEGNRADLEVHPPLQQPYTMIAVASEAPENTGAGWHWPRGEND